jgi:hypothetical protein
MIAAILYVGYRSPNPNKGTLKRVQNELRKNNITGLLKFPRNDCQ